MNGIVGLIEVTRSFVYKITGDAQPHSGMGKFESKEWFASRKTTAIPEHSEEVGQYLYALCEAEVMAAADKHANFLNLPTEGSTQAPNVSVETPAPPAIEHQPAPQQYVVAEKTEPTPAPEISKKANGKPPSAIVAERLKKKGLTGEELAAAACLHCGKVAGYPFKQAEYLAAFTALEQWLETHTIEQYRAQLAAPPAQDPTPADPAVAEATKQICAKWPGWSPELVKIAALWCADQVKDANVLDACLISVGVKPDTSLGKIESLLAISRHMAMGSMIAVTNYAKLSQDPLGLIEEQLSKAVGKPIRFAMDLPPNAVADAFQAMVAEQHKKKGAK